MIQVTYLTNTFSHDCLHYASLQENIFTKNSHKTLQSQPGFKSKYLEIKSKISDMKKQMESLSDPRVRNSIIGEHYDIKTKKADLAVKIEKLMQKILDATQVRYLNEKTRYSMYTKKDESGLMSMNESDISKGAFDIGNYYKYNV